MWTQDRKKTTHLAVLPQARERYRCHLCHLKGLILRNMCIWRWNSLEALSFKKYLIAHLAPPSEKDQDKFLVPAVASSAAQLPLCGRCHGCSRWGIKSRMETRPRSDGRAGIQRPSMWTRHCRRFTFMQAWIVKREGRVTSAQRGFIGFYTWLITWARGGQGEGWSGSSMDALW